MANGNEAKSDMRLARQISFVVPISPAGTIRLKLSSLRAVRSAINVDLLRGLFKGDDDDCTNYVGSLP
jgi:hypothetical protein